jgi:hypothetical protein
MAVRVRPYLENKKLGPAEEWHRATIVTALQNHKALKTAFRQTDGKLYPGKRVRIVTIDKVMYIRTDEESMPADELGSLPDF